MAIVFSENNIITTNYGSEISSACTVDLTDLELVYSENSVAYLISEDIYQISFRNVENLVNNKLTSLLIDYTDTEIYKAVINDVIFKLEIFDSRMPNLIVNLRKDENIIASATVYDSLIQEFIPMKNYYIEIYNNSTNDVFFKYELIVKYSKSIMLEPEF